MGLFDNFPYTNFHELNLDWILKVLKDIETTIDQFVSLNIIKYADPIQWDITRQYPKNMIVVDPISGTAYISVDNVPQGVPLSNTDYWSVVFDLGRFITLASQNFANSYESVLTTTATMPTARGHWVVWNSILYEALNDIHVGDAYVIATDEDPESGNIKKTTVESFYDRLIAQIRQEIIDRAAADTALGDRIDQEILDRAAAATALGNRIDQEILDRTAADTALGDRIDQEILDRISAVDAERDARILADSELEERIITATNSVMKTIFDYGYESGENITQYVQRFINDDNASQIYFNMSGAYVIDALDVTPITGSVNQIKYFYKSANCYISGEGGATLSLTTMSDEAAEMTASYSVGGCGYPLRWVHNADVAHTPNGFTQMNACFIDNIKNANDGYYHWNLFAQSNIYSNTRAEDCVGYLQAHVYGDNENWALATENILHINNEYHSTRGIEISITGNGDVSPNGGKRIGIHIANNTTGSGFNSDYAVYVTSHSRDTGWKTVFRIDTGYSDYLLKATGNYGCTYGIDLSEARINAAAIKCGRTQPRGIQFQDYRFYEDDVNSENCIQLASQAHTIATPLTLTTSNGTPVQYLKVVYDGVPYAIPLCAI